MRYGGDSVNPANFSQEFWLSYAAFLKSEKRRHEDDIAMIEERLQRVKPLAGPRYDSLPDDLWVDEEDMHEGKNSRYG